MKCDKCGVHMRLEKRECSVSCCSDLYECDICKRVKLTSSLRDRDDAQTVSPRALVASKSTSSKKLWAADSHSANHNPAINSAI